ncbi:hypothetical protein PR048_016998 [Dryococelus australis]|uniref:Rho-GAP domain-containing protein n=1 Tax=Dryococelus australis TaxID=614101 RepID=A0ABQ9H8B1_9NEOP|nr:hypothetical protein PR048_016998 [Dryococelus australis]
MHRRFHPKLRNKEHEEGGLCVTVDGGVLVVVMERLGSASDVELAERLRAHNPEQFHTLVRMHLSFLLDLSTDDSESGVAERSWLRTLKPGWLSLTRKSRSAGRTGLPLTQETICQVYQLIEFLSREQNVCQEGIFRRSGSVLRQQELKQRLSKGVALHLDQGHFSVHDCASVLKGFLAELPDSLLTDAHYPAYCHIAGKCHKKFHNRLLLQNSEQLLLLLLLPEENRALLRDLLRLLHLAASRPSNKMAADTLATLFTPHLLCPRKLSPEEFHLSAQTMSRVVAFMIQQGPALFQIPAPLALDVRAYWLERHKRRLSQQGDGAEASTVFSFVDRERSVENGDVNPTQVALAELYAHVQALPESGHKRRLLKQQNHHNGDGPGETRGVVVLLVTKTPSNAKLQAESGSLCSWFILKGVRDSGDKKIFHVNSRPTSPDRVHQEPQLPSALHNLMPSSPSQEPSSSDDCSVPLCGSLLRSRRSQSVVRQRRPRPRVTSLTYQEEASVSRTSPSVAWTTSTPAGGRAVTPGDSSSMSPITWSAHRMPRAMQVSSSRRTHSLGVVICNFFILPFPS